MNVPSKVSSCHEHESQHDTNESQQEKQEEEQEACSPYGLGGYVPIAVGAD